MMDFNCGTIYIHLFCATHFHKQGSLYYQPKQCTLVWPNAQRKTHLPSLKLTAKAPENGWLVFSYWGGLFSGAFAVSFREGIYKAQKTEPRPAGNLVFDNLTCIV